MLLITVGLVNIFAMVLARDDAVLFMLQKRGFMMMQFPLLVLVLVFFFFGGSLIVRGANTGRALQYAGTSSCDKEDHAVFGSGDQGTNMTNMTEPIACSSSIEPYQGVTDTVIGDFFILSVVIGWLTATVVFSYMMFETLGQSVFLRKDAPQEESPGKELFARYEQKLKDADLSIPLLFRMSRQTSLLDTTLFAAGVESPGHRLLLIEALQGLTKVDLQAFATGEAVGQAETLL
jgi:hypothetical protein